MAVKSPCIDLCAFDGKTGLCTGCYRTREEARGWKRMTDHRRHQILNEKSRRQTTVELEKARISNDEAKSIVKETVALVSAAFGRQAKPEEKPRRDDAQSR